MGSTTTVSNSAFISKHVHLNIRRADDVDVPVQLLSIQVYSPIAETSSNWQPQIVMLAFSQPTWSMVSEKTLRSTIGQMILANPTNLLSPPTRIHTHRRGWDVWSEPRSIWILVGEDGLYHIIMQREEGNHVELTPFPSFTPGVARGSHKALCTVIGKQVADQLALDTQRLLALNFPDI